MTRKLMITAPNNRDEQDFPCIRSVLRRMEQFASLMGHPPVRYEQEEHEHARD
jgi:hypothetical protein